MSDWDDDEAQCCLPDDEPPIKTTIIPCSHCGGFGYHEMLLDMEMGYERIPCDSCGGGGAIQVKAKYGENKMDSDISDFVGILEEIKDVVGVLLSNSYTDTSPESMNSTITKIWIIDQPYSIATPG